MGNQTIDPVCGMTVDRRKENEQVTFQGQQYYFCSEPCAQQFQANPSRYVGAHPTE